MRSARIGLRHLPPVAVPVHGRDLARGLRAIRNPDRALAQFRAALLAQTGSSACHLLSSGRAALTVILLGLKRLSDRTKIIVPAYSCPTVVQAVMEAGLEPVLCDVSPQTLDLDRDALDRLLGRDVLGVVPVHLYGLAQDVRDLLAAGREREFFVVEDAAQAYGAGFQGRMVGTWGDAGLYSLGRGKCLPAGHGGVIVSGERCASAIGEVVAESAARKPRRGIGSLALFLGYALATRPASWWLIARSPLNPADEGMDASTLPPIRLSRLAPVQAGIATSILESLDRIQVTRRRNAQRLTNLLSGFGFVSLPQIPPGADPVFLRLPIVVDREERADRLFDLLDRSGCGGSRSYRRSLHDLYSGRLPGEPRQFPGAERLATCLLTLPTHHHLREDDFGRIAAAFHAAG
jgi:perosamine synthetase